MKVDGNSYRICYSKNLELMFFAVRKDDKWGKLDVYPLETYITLGISDYKPNFKDLEFKYDSFNSLMKEVDKEFKNQSVKYYKLRANNSWAAEQLCRGTRK